MRGYALADCVDAVPQKEGMSCAVVGNTCLQRSKSAKIIQFLIAIKPCLQRVANANLLKLALIWNALLSNIIMAAII